MSPTARSVDIPFDYQNNFIIMHFIINGKLPLSFILDTGAGHTIITKKEIADILNLSFDREFQIVGSDLTKPLTAWLVRSVRFDMPGKITAPLEDILILEEDFFQFEEYTGMTIHGIMSANVFAKYLFKINYDRKVITLYNREFFSAKDLKSYETLPIEIKRDKPYLNTRIQAPGDSTVAVKLLLDTGAGMPLLLFADTHPLLQPPPNALPSNIGVGLGGDLEGFTGRIQSIALGQLEQSNVVTYYQTLDSLVDREAANYRNGLIGNSLLSHFTVVFDYYNEKIHLKPSKKYKKAYVFDRSGMTVISSGLNMSAYVVQYVLPNSPAEEAGIQKGDHILKVGRKPALLLSLPALNKELQAKPGKKVSITIERGGERFKKVIVLRDLL